MHMGYNTTDNDVAAGIEDGAAHGPGLGEELLSTLHVFPPPSPSRRAKPQRCWRHCMIEYKTDTRTQRTGTKTRARSAEELLEERRAYYYDLVDRVFDPTDDPQ